jgi:hypothetical protein
MSCCRNDDSTPMKEHDVVRKKETVPKMKILLTADLHYRLPWYQWLIDQGPKYDLVCIAGDFLDIFNDEPRENHARVASVLVRELGRLTRVAVCSGNHDIAGRQVTVDRAPLYEWFVWLGDHPKILTDGVTRLVEDLVVTTIPYHVSKAEKSIWLDRGRSFASSAVASGWSFTTSRPISRRRSPGKNAKPPRSSLSISRIIFWRGIFTNSLTWPGTVRLKGSAERLCSCRASY